LKIGTFESVNSLAEAYAQLAKADERVGRALAASGEYRHSIYFLVQAIEKQLRAKIFSLVDGRNIYFREKNRNHSVEDAAAFLVEVVSPDVQMQAQIKQQLETFVISGIRYNHLHNDLRYPIFSERTGTYRTLQVSKADADAVLARLEWVKRFVRAV
jgi:hypothetical protein